MLNVRRLRVRIVAVSRRRPFVVTVAVYRIGAVLGGVLQVPDAGAQNLIVVAGGRPRRRVVVEQGVGGDEDAHMGAHAVDGGQLPGTQDLVDDGGQGVGAALAGAAQVVPARRGHGRVQGGEQRRSGFGVQ